MNMKTKDTRGRIPTQKVVQDHCKITHNTDHGSITGYLAKFIQEYHTLSYRGYGYEQCDLPTRDVV